MREGAAEREQGGERRGGRMRHPEYRQMETTRMRESSRVGPVGGQSLSVRHVEVERRVLRHDIPA